MPRSEAFGGGSRRDRIAYGVNHSVHVGATRQIEPAGLARFLQFLGQVRVLAERTEKQRPSLDSYLEDVPQRIDALVHGLR